MAAGVVWDGRTPPSGVVAGFRRGVAGNVSEKKSRAVLERSMPLLPTMQKAGWRPLGGLKPRPMLAKRDKCRVRQAVSVLGSSSGNFSLPPFTGEGARRAEGGMKLPGDVDAGFAKAASLLGFTAATLAFETLQATSLHFSFCHSAAVLFQKLPSGINTRLAKRELFPSPVYGGRCPKGGRGG